MKAAFELWRTVIGDETDNRRQGSSSREPVTSLVLPWINRPQPATDGNGDDNERTVNQNWNRYVYWISPIIAANILIDPFMAFDVKTNLRQKPELWNLMYRKGAPWWTRITHMFVHHDTLHL